MELDFSLFCKKSKGEGKPLPGLCQPVASLYALGLSRSAGAVGPLWIRLDDPTAFGGGHSKKHRKKHSRDITPGWLLARSPGRKRGQGRQHPGSSRPFPRHPGARPSSQPGTGRSGGRLGVGKGMWVFLLLQQE